jgi:hypothetical protein
LTASALSAPLRAGTRAAVARRANRRRRDARDTMGGTAGGAQGAGGTAGAGHRRWGRTPGLALRRVQRAGRGDSSQATTPKLISRSTPIAMAQHRRRREGRTMRASAASVRPAAGARTRISSGRRG